jgi:hypothetical protein
MAMGCSAAAPSPWKPRKAINWFMFCATPQAAEPIKNRTIPIRKMIFRPKISESFPYIGIITVEVRR